MIECILLNCFSGEYVRRVYHWKPALRQSFNMDLVQFLNRVKGGEFIQWKIGIYIFFRLFLVYLF